MNITVSELENVTTTECINCMECTTSCPENALSVSGWKVDSWKIKPVLLIAITLLIFILVVGTTTMTK